MRTLIDTSAWIQFFRPKGDPKLKSKVNDIMAVDEAIFTCPIHYELHIGARPDEVNNLKTGLELAERCYLTGPHWDAASVAGFRLKKRGISVPLPDVLIATVAVLEQLPLLQNDSHFELIRDNALPELNLYHI